MRGLFTVDVLLLALVVLDDGLPALPHHHPCLAPAQRLGLVGFCLFPLMFRPSVLKPDFHLKLFIVITFYINLINNSDWLCVCVKEFEEMNQGMSYTSAQASQRSHSCSWLDIYHCSGLAGISQ